MKKWYENQNLYLTNWLTMSKKRRYRVSDQEPQDQKSVELHLVFAALANQQRLDVLYLLSSQTYSVTQLAFMLELSLPAILKHIKILESVELIARKKVGNTNFLSLNRELFKDIYDSFGTIYKRVKADVD